MLEVGLLAVGVLVILLTLGVPLPYCFGGGLMVMYFIGDVTMKGMMLWGFQQLGNPVLLAIPLFVLAAYKNDRLVEVKSRFYQGTARWRQHPAAARRWDDLHALDHFGRAVGQNQKLSKSTMAGKASPVFVNNLMRHNGFQPFIPVTIKAELIAGL